VSDEEDPTPGGGPAVPGPGPESSGDDALATGPSATDIDSRFASIVAHWDEEAIDAPPDEWGPTLTPLAPTPDVAPDVARWPRPGDEAADPDDEQLFGWRGYTPAEDDEHFDPPAPVLPPAHDATYWLAVLGICLGPLLIVWAAVLSRNPDPGWWVLLGIALTVAGFGLMVVRGSGDRDPNDNGARV